MAAKTLRLNTRDLFTVISSFVFSCIAMTASSQIANDDVTPNFEDAFFRNLVVCSDLDFATNDTLREYYRNIGSSAFTYLSDSRLVLGQPVAPMFLVASNGKPSDSLVNCLERNASIFEDIDEISLNDISGLGQPPIGIEEFPGLGIGLTQRVWGFHKSENMRLVVYGSLESGPNEVVYFYEKFFFGITK